jgi:hypothetical protein
MFMFLMPGLVKQLQRDNESVTLVQVSQLFLGQKLKNRKQKMAQFENLYGFGVGKSKFYKSEVERILHQMVYRQYVQEQV